MHYHLPIEQVVTRKDTRFQLGFAREATTVVPAHDDFLLSPSERGLRVLARSEELLCRPIEALRDTYGEMLDVTPPQARLMAGAQVKEPIMDVRVTLQSQYRDAVKRALLERGARAEGEYVRPTYSILHYEGALADLLGLPAELSRLTSGTARHWMILSHYAIVTRDPGGRAA